MSDITGDENIRSAIKKDNLPMEQVFYLNDPGYPKRLKQIPRPPAKIYVRGQLPGENEPAVAIIGARNCSDYGQDMAKWFAIELARKGVQIISGMARGIDGVSQWAALRAGGKSYGVLGCGTDICYPGENKPLYERLLREGGIISEFPPGTQPLSRNFPSRNRIISGLADIVLVIEAREKSGTLITVDYALSQGKDVFALPGRVGDYKSAGCNGLIHMGAFMALSPGDILEALGLGGRESVLSMPAAFNFARDYSNNKEKEAQNREFKNNVKKLHSKKAPDMPGTGEESPPEKFCTLEEKELKIWEALSLEPKSLDNIYEHLETNEFTLQELITHLMNMVLKNAVIITKGNYSRRPHVLPE